jgi:hypothetical protein
MVEAFFSWRPFHVRVICRHIEVAKSRSIAGAFLAITSLERANSTAIATGCRARSEF